MNGVHPSLSLSIESILQNGTFLAKWDIFSDFETLWRRMAKKNLGARRKNDSPCVLCVLAPIPGIGMMMTHCMNSTGKATFKPLEAISDPHSRVYKVPLARTVLGNLQNFFALISISSAEGVAIRNNDRTNVNGKFSAIITECTNLCELIYNSSPKSWTLNNF